MATIQFHGKINILSAAPTDVSGEVIERLDYSVVVSAESVMHGCYYDSCRLSVVSEKDESNAYHCDPTFFVARSSIIECLQELIKMLNSKYRSRWAFVPVLS
jgi:hypothetical protein